MGREGPGQSSFDTLKQIGSGNALYPILSSELQEDLGQGDRGWQVVQQKVKCLRTVMDEVCFN